MLLSSLKFCSGMLCFSCSCGTRLVKSDSASPWSSIITGTFMLLSLCMTWPRCPLLKTCQRGLRSVTAITWTSTFPAFLWAINVMWLSVLLLTQTWLRNLLTRTTCHCLRHRQRMMKEPTMSMPFSWRWRTNWRILDPWCLLIWQTLSQVTPHMVNSWTWEEVLGIGVCSLPIKEKKERRVIVLADGYFSRLLMLLVKSNVVITN